AGRRGAFIRPILRPAVRAGFRWYYGFRGWQGRLPAMWAERRGRLRAMLAAAERRDVVGIGRRAVGRHIVMLVVSDLRIDPRVEREARALVSAGYRVTVICPEPTQGKH